MKLLIYILCLIAATVTAQEPKHVIAVGNEFKVVYDHNKASSTNYHSFAEAELVLDRWRLEHKEGYWTNFPVVDTVDPAHLTANGLSRHPLAGPRQPKGGGPAGPPMPPSPAIPMIKKQAAHFTPSHP